MQWKQYVLKQMLTPNPTAIPVPSEEVQHVVWLERKVASHSNLRGIMVYLVLLSLTVSLFQFDSLLGNLIVHFVLLILSLSGVGCVIALYKIEAIFRGMPNPAFPAVSSYAKPKTSDGEVGTTTLKKHHFSVFHSPSFFWMMVEIFVWLIHSPTGTLEVKWEKWLTSLMFLRTYVIAIYLSERWSSSLYSRAINAILGFQPSFSLDSKRSHFSEKWIWGSLICIVFFLLTALYRRVEDISWMDAWYFCASTALSLSFGQVTPTTVVGRFITFFLWILGLLFLVSMIRLWVEYLTLSEFEYGVYSMLNTYRSRSQFCLEAVKTIQRAWRLYALKRRQSSRLLVHCCAVLLTRQCIKFRKTRRQAKLATVVAHEKQSNQGPQQETVFKSRSDNRTIQETCSSQTRLTCQCVKKKGLCKGGEFLRAMESDLDHLICQLRVMTKRTVD